MPPSLTEVVWEWAQTYDFGVGAPPLAVQELWLQLHARLSETPRLFRQGWPESEAGERRTKPQNVCVVHAVCMLEPGVATQLLTLLSAISGFYVEQRSENGVTPLVAAVYSRFGNRVVLLKTLLDLGANPNSPADATEKLTSRQEIRRKPAVAHLLLPCTSVFGRQAAFPTRSSQDTDSIQLLVERGAHFGASYTCAPAIRVNRFRAGNERYKDGHCLPDRLCYRDHGSGHAFQDLQFNAESPGSLSVAWLERLLKRHCRTTVVSNALTARPVLERLKDERKIKFRWQMPSPYDASSLRLRSNDVGLPVYRPIQREVWATLYALSRTNLIPQDVHALVLHYLVPSHPYPGFYDATRLERLWSRQRSPYIDTGYVVPTSTVALPGEVALVTEVKQHLVETMQPIFYGQHPRLAVPVDTAIYEDVANVAAGLFGATATISPEAYRRVLAPNFRRIGGQNYPFSFVSLSPEGVQRELIFAYVCNDADPTVARFARWLCVEVLRSAIRRVYEAIRANETLDDLTISPLSAAQVSYIDSQF